MQADNLGTLLEDVERVDLVIQDYAKFLQAYNIRWSGHGAVSCLRSFDLRWCWCHQNTCSDMGFAAVHSTNTNISWQVVLPKRCCCFDLGPILFSTMFQSKHHVYLLYSNYWCFDPSYLDSWKFFLMLTWILPTHCECKPMGFCLEFKRSPKPNELRAGPEISGTLNFLITVGWMSHVRSPRLC